MGHNVVNGRRREHHRSTRGSPTSSSPWVRAHGYEDVGVIDDKYNIDRIRAERDADIARRGPGREGRTARATRPSRPRPERRARRPSTPSVPTTTRTSAVAGISIEANADAGAGDLHEPEHGHGLRLHRPGRCRPSRRTTTEQQADRPAARRRPTSIRTPTVSAGLLPVPLPRSSGSATRATAAPMPASVEDLRAQRRPSTPSPRRSGSPKNPPAYAQALPARLRRRATTPRYEALRPTIRDLAARVPRTSPRRSRLPEQTCGLPCASAADDARLPRHGART